MGKNFIYNLNNRLKVDINNDRKKVEELIYNAPLRTYNTCHSFMVYKYPESYPEEYEDYLELKSITLVLLFSMNKKKQKIQKDL